MRHLIIPACLCLMTWSTATGPEPILPLENMSGTATSESSSDLGYEVAVLPLAPLHLLLKPIIPRSREEICGTLVETARSNDLPAPFFIRLLYQESGFRPGAISSAGALGIAQFMPETANDRGLDNPFDPLQAIPASAHMLHALYQKFGNLGLAAAAYNAGPKRIEDWLASKGELPQETQDYVNAITGWPAETWKTAVHAGSPAVKLPEDAPCQEAAGLLAWNGPDQIPLPPPNPRAMGSPSRLNRAGSSSTIKSATKEVRRGQLKAMPTDMRDRCRCSARSCVDRGVVRLVRDRDEISRCSVR